MIKRLLSIGALAIGLTGCFVPEKFDVEVDFAQDLSYSYTYEGTVAFFPALVDIKGGKHTAQSDKKLEAEGAALKAKNPQIQKFSYAGNGRYDAVIKANKKPGERSDLLDTLVIATDKDGRQWVVAKTSNKDAANMGDVGLKLDGHLKVKLPKNANILGTNGTVSDTFFGFGRKVVEWKVEKMETRPQLSFNIGQSK
jgi:hypothetical protein